MQDFSNFIEQLKSKNDIADIVSKYVSLEKKGGKLWGRCPFHNEKTPSFTINSDGQYYHCFGCGASGDVIKFIQEIESIDFMEAVKLLCEKCGMEIPNNFEYKEDHNTKELKEKRDRLYSLLKDTARYYHSMVYKNDNVLKYIQQRKISENYIKKFGIGYSPDYKGVIKHLIEKGYKTEDIIDSGIGINKNGNITDTMGTRLIIPIINVTGDVIAFGGRDLTGNSPAKYKNTAETPVFIKSKNLYAINLIKKSKPKDKRLIIVEGYMDAIALHQAGFSNTVASMGTSLTKEQARLAKRFCDEVYICYDGDSAGQTATLRGLDILSGAGLLVKVISMPNDMDPDEYIQQKGSSSYKKLLQNAPMLPDYKIDLLSKKYNNETADGKRKFAIEAINVISKEESQITKEELLKQLRDKTGYTYDSLKRELENIGANNQNNNILPNVNKQTQTTSMQIKAARFILYCLLKNKEYAKTEDISEEYLSNSAHIKILQYIKECKNKNKEIRISSLFDGENDKENIFVAEYGDDMTQEEQKKYYEDCVKDYKAINYEKKLKILTAEYEQEKDLNKRKEIALKIQLLAINQKKNK